MAEERLHTCDWHHAHLNTQFASPETVSCSAQLEVLSARPSQSLPQPPLLLLCRW
jgi:hypothetical protein